MRTSPIELRCDVKSRQYWIELPRQAFDSRFESGSPPLLAHFDLSRGLGHIAMEFCAALAAEGAGLDAELRAKLGEQFMDILALALSGEPDRQPADERSVQRARLRSVKAYIDAHLSDPNLSLSEIAKKNGISLRYLHQLFRLTDMSASEWLRLRRLQRCYDMLTSPRPRDAIDHGNRLFDGIQQFVPFQQSLSRAIRRAAVGRQGRLRLSETFSARRRSWRTGRPSSAKGSNDRNGANAAEGCAGRLFGCANRKQEIAQ